MKKTLSILLSLIMLLSAVPFIGLTAAFKASAASEGTRELVDINSGWTFYLETLESQATSSYTVSNFASSLTGKEVNLPHDWSVEQDFTTSYSTEDESAKLPGGVGWYTKTVTAEEMSAYIGKHVLIEFGGVYQSSELYVNGSKVGECKYGYISFAYDLTSYFASRQSITLTVLVTNQLPNSRWYSGSGIYRKVFLEVTDPVHIGYNGTYVYTPDIEAEYNANRDVTVNVEAEINNDSSASKTVTVANKIVNSAGAQVGTTSVESVTAAAGATQTSTQTLAVAKPDLWSTDAPNLYKVITTVSDTSGAVLDTYETEFGFRWFTFTNTRGFYLNGEPTKLLGVCMHHDQGSLGAAAYTQAIQRQLEMLKEMGCNAIRTSHNPASKELIQLCDKMGFLVIEETYDTWDATKNGNTYDFSSIYYSSVKSSGMLTANECSNDWYCEFVAKAMADRDKNDASVFLWSVGNEIAYAWSPEGYPKDISGWINEVDPYAKGGRKKTIADNQNQNSTVSSTWQTMFNNLSYSDETDTLRVVGENYANSGLYSAAANGNFTSSSYNYMFYTSESASAIRSRGEYAHGTSTQPLNNGSSYTASSGSHQMSSYDNDFVSWGATAMYDWALDIAYDAWAGEFVWTGFDYLGEPSPYYNLGISNPKSSYFGIIDTAGFEKDIYYFYQSQWRDVNDQLVLHILPHWNLTASQLTSGEAKVVVYSNARSVELFYEAPNGATSSLGKKSFQQYSSSENLRTYQKTADSSSVYSFALEWNINYATYENGRIYAIAYDENNNAYDSTEASGRTSIQKAGAISDLSLGLYSFNGSYDIPTAAGDDFDLLYVTVDLVDSNGTLCPNADDELSLSVAGNGTIIGVDNGNAADPDLDKYSDKTSVNAYNGKALVIIKGQIEGSPLSLTVSCAGITKTMVFSDTSYGINISEENVTLNKGKTSKLNVSSTLPPSDKNIGWITSNKDVATAANGVITARGAGTCTITAITSYGAYTDSVTVTVSDITASKNSAVLNAGAKTTLFASVAPSALFADTPITWESSDNNVATVNNNGEITAVGTGSCIVAAIANGIYGAEASCLVTVVEQNAAMPQNETYTSTGEIEVEAPTTVTSLTDGKKYVIIGRDGNNLYALTATSGLLKTSAVLVSTDGALDISALPEGAFWTYSETKKLQTPVSQSTYLYYNTRTGIAVGVNSTNSVIYYDEVSPDTYALKVYSGYMYFKNGDFGCSTSSATATANGLATVYEIGSTTQQGYITSSVTLMSDYTGQSVSREHIDFAYPTSATSVQLGASVMNIPTDASTSWSVYYDANGVVASVTDGKVTLSGNTGNAIVKVEKDWNDNGTNASATDYVYIFATPTDRLMLVGSMGFAAYANALNAPKADPANEQQSPDNPDTGNTGTDEPPADDEGVFLRFIRKIIEWFRSLFSSFFN